MPTPSPERDPRIASLPASEIRSRFLEYFAERGHTVVPSSSLVPAGDATLLFVNSGMVPFKDALTGAEKRSYTRAVNFQRCLRVAGKHNDFEEVGRSPSHHTLFEMLGNWSFGDYFKREAIHWAWDFMTKELGIPGERLAATTYTTDDVAFDIWQNEIGLPENRLVRWGDFPNGDEKNWWRMGDIGPCGPCSEIHFDRGAQFSEGDFCVPDHSEFCPRWLEVWNLVFMEFELHPDRSLTPLPAPGIDTGMGLERIASVVQQVPSNYDTDLFAAIHERMRELLGHDPESFEAERFSYQVIADHSRAITFLVGDGVLPSNEGRGYVCRRILRRAVRHGRLLGRNEPFLAETAKVVIDSMADAYPHLRDGEAEILAAISREERQFIRTLEAGTDLLEEVLIPLTSNDRVVGLQADSLPEDAPTLAGDVAFKLHDTYGFPIDLTVELAAEYGVRVDRPGFEAALAEQRERSRSGKKAELKAHAEMASLYQGLLGRAGPTEFLGYDTTSAEGKVAAIIRDGIEFDELEAKGDEELRTPAGAAAEIVLDRTPFYAEGGGQVGDKGVLRLGDAVVFEVDDTLRVAGTQTAGLIVHRGTLRGRVKVGDAVAATVFPEQRAHTMRNHTGTHLLHRALRNVVGERAKQAGSLVAPGYLRFDFPFDRALTTDEKRAIEDEVRRIVREDRSITVELLPLAEAIDRGADALFDEKYGETVRTVRVKDYSFELCGGTHCRASGQVGSFVITAERSIGSGMRRIEALTGAGADDFLRGRSDALERAAGLAGATNPDSLPERIAALQEELRDTRKKLKAKGSEGGGQADGRIPKPSDLRDRLETHDGVSIVTLAAPFESPEAMKGYAKDLRSALGANVIALALDADQPQVFVTADETAVAKGISAGDLVRVAVAKIDGKGGGRPEMAQGRGTKRDGVAGALDAIRSSVRDSIG
jgi:alanyl-tRNA synthetase